MSFESCIQSVKIVSQPEKTTFIKGVYEKILQVTGIGYGIGCTVLRFLLDIMYIK